MTGKVLDSGATSPLILILPIALVMIVLFTAWPLILLLIILSFGWKFWEHYQWKQWCKQVDPFFHGLIKENRGRLTPVDLSLKANLTGRAARQFLEKKAEEYGAQHQEQEQGTVYYFMTASALGSIFDDSEPLSEPEGDEFEQENTLQLASASSAVETSESSSAPVQWEEPKVAQSLRNETTTQTSEQLNRSDRSLESLQNGSSVEILEREEMNGSSSSSNDLLTDETIEEESEDESTEAPTQISAQSNGLTNQPEKNATELAKRLDLHPSTVGKRKSDADFPEWSQSKDPDGIAWQYVLESKLFVPLELDAESP